MLEVERKFTQRSIPEIKKFDIIVERINETVTYENKKKIIEEKTEYINLTKKINETKKLLKVTQAQALKEKLAEIEEIYTK